MKKVLLILDGDVAKALLNRLIQANITHSEYDVVYINDNLIEGIEKSSNFIFYKFDPTSYSKISLILSKKNHEDCLVVFSNKFDTLEIVSNIKKIKPSLFINVYNMWNLEFDFENLNNFNAISELSNALFQKLPNIPVLAQNVGMKKGEIMEVKIPFGSPYAYRYIGSISQEKFKIVALYRNAKLVLIKPTIILKPNDIILLVGEPKVLLHIYNSITNIFGNFPLPFGKNIYLFLDLAKINELNVLNLVEKAKQLHLRLNSSKLIIKIINPSTVSLLNKIKQILKEVNELKIEIFYDLGLDFNLIKEDVKRFEVGMIVIDKTYLKNKKLKKLLFSLNLPLFKSNSLLPFLHYKEISVVLNDIIAYEQISPIIFDIAMQLKFEINVIDSDPVGDKNRAVLIEYIKNLNQIFNIKTNISSNHNNPIKELFKFNNTIQILPIIKEIKQNSIFNLFSTNSDIISFKKNK